MQSSTSIRLLFVSALVSALVWAAPAYAVKRVPFPSSTSLQPIPAIAHPGVSGNISSTTDATTTRVAIPPIETPATPVPQTIQETSPLAPAGGDMHSALLYTGAAVLSILIVIFIKHRYFADDEE